jgi:hypothetical protein
MTTPTQVLVTSCETGPGAWRHQEEMIRANFPRNDAKLILTEDPAGADIIFVGNLRSENNYATLRRHEYVRRFPAKTYVIGDGDQVPRFCQGILTALTRSPQNLGRFRSGSYFLYHSDFKNPFVERWFAARANPTQPAPPKEYLASFAGRNCIPMRGRLLGLKWKRTDVLIRDTSNIYDNFTHQPMGKGPQQQAYFNVAMRSKFMLCPRGDGAASIRFFEAMQLGIAPVLISDDWVLPEGPDWTKCMLRVGEHELHHLEEILERHEAQAEAIGAEAQRVYADYFHGENYVRYLVAAARSIRRSHTFLPERCFRFMWTPALLLQKVRRRAARWRRPVTRGLPAATPSSI